MPALSADVWSTRYARITTATQAADGTHDMEDHVQDDVHDSGSLVSGLTSLEGDDDFERLMIQNARDERRLSEALNGRAQAFRKARPHARVGLTLDNLERNEAQNSNAFAANARAAIKSPPSSSGSTRSDPAIHAPAGWGRKGRTSRNWLRTITRDEEPRRSRAPPEESLVEQHGQHEQRHQHDTHQHDTHDTHQHHQHHNAPRRSVQDSPLSHKSFTHATPRNDNSGEWDLTFDMNEASMLASTPYIPRNTKLDDIREREIESLREQGVATARLDRIRESSPEERRRPRSSAATSIHTNSTPNTEASSREQGSPRKPQPELGREKSPFTVYRKTVETVGVVEHDVVVSAETQPPRPFSNQKTDSHDLLRRLSRKSSTPSPKGTLSARPQTDPAPQPPSSSHAPVTGISHTRPEQNREAIKAMPAEHTAAASASTPQEQPHREQRHDTPHDGTTPDMPSSAPTAEHVDATPLPVERSVLQPKTPYVMGGWVDTPGPRTSHKRLEPHRPRSQSPKNGITSRKRSSERPRAPTAVQQPAKQGPEPTQPSLPSLPRPQLPGSALHALVQEAKANHDYGDDTIHSLEDLMTPLADNEIEEDTLQGLPLPTSAPRSEAERGRQAEIVDLHRLNQHLRATSTSIRDASRGLRRVGTTVEHIEVQGTSEKLPIIVRDLSYEFSPWTWFRSFFWDERLKTQREVQNAPLKMWGGLTFLGIMLILSFIWWASETVACEIFCHPEYASYSPYPFAVNMDAPKRGVVIPTLVYRALFKSWSTPIISPVASLLSWIWASLRSLASVVNITGLSRPSYEAAASGGPETSAHTQASWKIQDEIHEQESWDWSMAEDEVLRR